MTHMKWMIAAVFVLVNSTAWALPTPVTAIGLQWQVPNSVVHTGFYIYWTGTIDDTKPCREQTTYNNTDRFDVDDPQVTTADFGTFLPNKLGVLCFAMTAHDDRGNESEFAQVKDGEPDTKAYTGMIAPSGFHQK